MATVKMTMAGVGNGNPLQDSCLENSKFHGQRRLAGYSPWGHKCWTQLTFTFKRKNKKKKKSPASSHIVGSEGQLLFDSVLISGEDQILLVLMYSFSLL